MNFNPLHILFAVIVASCMSCSSGENKNNIANTPNIQNKGSEESGEIVGIWNFEDIQGELFMKNFSNKNQLPGIKKMMVGSSIEFKEDGSTQHKDTYFKKDLKGSYKIKDSTIHIKNDIVSGEMQYGITGDTLTIVWPSETYLEQVSKMSQGLTSFEKLKEQVNVTDLTYIYLRDK